MARLVCDWVGDGILPELRCLYGVGGVVAAGKRFMHPISRNDARGNVRVKKTGKEKGRIARETVRYRKVRIPIWWIQHSVLCSTMRV